MNGKNIEPVNVLLMGMTGAGKSSFVNMSVNLAVKKQYLDDRLFAIPATFQDRDGRTIKRECNVNEFKDLATGEQKTVGESDTKFVNCYDLQFADGFRLNLIDTPGFNDTRGNQQDELNARLVVEQITAVAQIHAIVWVSKSSENRVSAELRYCIEMFTGLLPRGYERNFFVVFTHVGNALKVDAQQVLASLGIAVDVAFNFENSCLIPKDVLETYFQTESAKVDYDSEINLNTKMWHKNSLNFTELVRKLALIKPVSSMPIQQLYFKKHLLEKILERLGEFEESQLQTTPNATPNENKQQEFSPNPDSIKIPPQKKVKKSFIKKFLQSLQRLFEKVTGRKTKDLIDQSGSKLILKLKGNEHNHGALPLHHNLQSAPKEEATHKTEELMKDIAKLKAIISLLEDLIKQEAPGQVFTNINALEVISNRIFILQRCKDIPLDQKQKEIGILEKSQNRILFVNKLLSESHCTIDDHTVIDLIICLQEVVDLDMEISQSLRENAVEKLEKMHEKYNELAKKSNPQDYMKDFNEELNVFIQEVYIKTMASRRSFVVSGSR